MRTFLRSAAAALACALCTLQAIAAASEVGPAPRWLEWTHDRIGSAGMQQQCDVSPALAAAWDQGLLTLAQQLARTGLPWPEGWHGDLRGVDDGEAASSANCRSRPLTGYVVFAVWLPGKLKQAGARLQRPGPADLGSGAAAAALYMHVNEFKGTDDADWLKDGAGPRMGLGGPTGSIGGYPVWGGRWLLVTPASHPAPFVPATLERVVKAWVAVRNAELEQIVAGGKLAEQAGNPALVQLQARMAELTRARITKTRSLLDGPPARLQGPAYVGPLDEVRATPASDAVQVWVDNPAYFKPQLPRSALQLLAIDLVSLEGEPTAAGRLDGKGLVRLFMDRTDWRRVAADQLQ